jgi:catechol 2,3-dioxygenase-like lactoylglutathione lyase family enzyme
VDCKLELVSVPVADVERAKAFYTEQVGFVLDHDHVISETLRFVQITPRGSACSIALGVGITDSPPGTAQLQVVVDDVAAAREQLVAGGVEASEVDEQPWGSFVHFADPDGNRWAVQQLPQPRE